MPQYKDRCLFLNLVAGDRLIEEVTFQQRSKERSGFLGETQCRRREGPACRA
jgi:hypothetical protein